MYKELLEMPEADPAYHTYSAACLFYMANYDEAKEAALKGKHKINLCRDVLLGEDRHL